MKRFFILVLSSVLLFSGLAKDAKAADWTTYQKDWDHNGTVLEDSIIGTPELQWSKHSILANFHPPLYYGDNLYFLEYSNIAPAIWTAFALQKSTGRELWRTGGEGYPTSGFTVGHDLVLVPGNKLVALDAATGQKRWEAGGSNYTFIFPALDSDKIYAIRRDIPGGYAGIFALSLNDGSVIWQRVYGGNVSGLSLYRNDVIVTSGNDSANNTYLDSFDTASGTLNWSYARSYNPAGPVVVDEPRGYGFTMGSTGALTQINLDTGTKVAESKWGASPTIPLLYDGKACYITSSASWVSAYSDLECYDYVNNARLPSKRIESGVRLSRYIANNPILVGDRIYISTAAGELASFKLDGSDYQKTALVADSLGSMIYADGTFLILNTLRNTVYAVSATPQLVIADSHIELTSPYKTDGDYHEYLGQTHSHYVPDVASWSEVYKAEPILPYDVESRYKEAGYDFVALTEHNVVTADPNVDGILHIANAEEDTQGPGGNHILSLGIQTPIDETKSDQERIDQIVNQGGVAILSHPNSKPYPWSLKDLLSTDGYSGVEIFNGAISQWKLASSVTGDYLSTDKFDALLSAQKRTWADAGDDYTPGDWGFDNAAIVVRSKSLSQEEILQNIRDGNFYAVQGSRAPRINVINDGFSVTATSNQQGTIKFIGKDGKELKKTNNVLASTYSPNGDEIYIRVEVEANGKKSWSQPVSVAKKEIASSYTSGEYLFSLDQAKLLSKNAEGVQTSTLSTADYPTQSPPLGYLGPVYMFTSDGQVQSGTNLSIDYSNRKLLTSEQNLSIYTFDDALSRWVKVLSTVNISDKTVKADLTHFSLYALSAEEPEDTEAPSVSLTAPATLTDLSGQVSFGLATSDNNAVIKTGLSIDDKLVGEDNDPVDGWRIDVDLNEFVNGNHKLKLTAEDLSGNAGQAEYDFSIQGSTFVLPQVSLDTPNESDELADELPISGTYSSSLNVSSIGAYIDDVYIADLPFDNGDFTKEIDWSQFNDGDYTLKIILVDEQGNTASIERAIHIGRRVSIASLKDRVELFYREGHFKNKGIRDAVIDKLNTAEYYENLGQIDERNHILTQLIAFIDHQAQLQKPHIDNYSAITLVSDVEWIVSN